MQPGSMQGMRSSGLCLAESVLLQLLGVAMQAGSAVLGICH